MTKIEQIKDAITKAANGYSKLTYEILDLPSFSSHNIKHLLNNLGSISKCYYEVGLHKGTTFIATNYKNNLVSLGCDNWSQFQENGIAKKMAYANCEKYLDNNKYSLIEADCFGSEIPKMPYKIDLYFYDGEHGYDNQKKGVTHFLHSMGDEFILVVDDFSWQEPKRGTYDGIKDAMLEILYEQVLWDGKENGMYHNGLGVFLLKK